MTWIKSGKIYEPYVPPSWSDGTDEEIVKALQKHYAGQIDLKEYWAVGDERQVTLSAMEALDIMESHAQQTVTFVLSNVGGKYLADGITECVFQVDQKNCLNETGAIHSSNGYSTNSRGWKSSMRRTWCNSTYYNAIPSTLCLIFKEFINQSSEGNAGTGIHDTIDYFALRAEIEIHGSTNYSRSGEGSQIKLYETASNKIKQINGSNDIWWTRSAKNNNSTDYCYTNSSGATNYAGSASYYGIAPFGVI